MNPVYQLWDSAFFSDYLGQLLPLVVLGILVAASWWLVGYICARLLSFIS